MYTAGGDNALVESVWNSSGNLWYDQDISTGKGIAPLAAGSHLTAYTWFENGLQQIRVYYQGQDGYIREAAHNSTSAGIWWKGAAPTIQDFLRAKSGTGLAIVSFPDTDEREAKLYYQSMDGKLVSYDYKPAATFAQSWQNQNGGFSHFIFRNGYMISTNKFPLNSQPRPRIYTRRNTSYRSGQHIWRHDATNILRPRWKIDRNLVESERRMAIMEHARCRSSRRCRSILLRRCLCLLPEQDGIPLNIGLKSECERVAIHGNNIEPVSEVALAYCKNSND